MPLPSRLTDAELTRLRSSRITLARSALRRGANPKAAPERADIGQSHDASGSDVGAAVLARSTRLVIMPSTARAASRNSRQHVDVELAQDGERDILSQPLGNTGEIVAPPNLPNLLAPLARGEDRIGEARLPDSLARRSAGLP